MRGCVVALLVIVATGAIAHAQQAPRAQFSLGRGKPYAGVPFDIDLVVEGFEETPAPVQPKLEILGAKVTPKGVTLNKVPSRQIVGGRLVETLRVVWMMSWRVVVENPGRMRVPATTVAQGTSRATAGAGEADVEAISPADDMKIVLELPKRPIYVGEIIPIKLTWLFRRQPLQDPEFNLPLLGLDAFTISVPPVTTRKALAFGGGAKPLQLSYAVDQATLDNIEYHRLVATFFATPRTVGKIEVPGTTVLAPLPVGRGDFFNTPSRMFRASDIARTLEVKPLPEANRPPTFAGAVGDQYSIDVRTSRSVVSLGEPVQLDITIKSNQRLDTLSFGKLDGEGRLPKDKFTAPEESPTGELSADGMTKAFKVVAQVTGPATEVPALAFSYFDPIKNAYQTIQSQPIALSVKGGSVVGASDVVTGAPAKRNATAADDTAMVNAELALSSASGVDDRPLAGTLLWILVGVLYAVPLALFGIRSWQLRTAGQREEAAEARAARRRVEELLDKAQTVPAREVAGALGAAMRELARVLDRRVDDNQLLAKLETESFSQDAAQRPLSPDVRSDAAGLLRRWSNETRRSAKKAAATATTIALALIAAPAPAHADSLADGRMYYQQAMEVLADATARKTAFARAAVAFGEAVRATPDRPELLADWGNAALGAGDIATATLAYRRALAIDGSNARARHNLAWLRGRQPELLRPVTSSSATDTLLFFHDWPRARRLLVGAAAFAIAILLLVPWSGRRRRSLTGLAVFPLAIWLAMVASVIFQDRHTDDAVVMDGVVLRAADSAGAPGALPQPLTRGAEVTLLEQRGAWTRIRIASGATGWVPGGSVEKVAP